LTHVATGPQVLIGSSMGAWLALLIARDPATDVAGLALIAPAWDMTERLMWGPAPREIRDTLLRDGVWHRPSLYCDDNYPITLRLIEDGRRHLLGDGPLDPGCAVRILHSLDDPDVPWQGSAALLEMFAADADARLTLVNGGGHRLSRDEDVVLLQREVGELVGTGNVALTKT
ncbi:MAG: alpha/beta fold hydrolase, partial [Pseudomonadota bacterium]